MNTLLFLYFALKAIINSHTLLSVIVEKLLKWKYHQFETKLLQSYLV